MLRTTTRVRQGSSSSRSLHGMKTARRFCSTPGRSAIRRPLPPRYTREHMDRPVLTRRLAGFGTSIFAEMTALARKHDAVNLGQGFPSFDGPEFVKQAAIEALRAGH